MCIAVSVSVCVYVQGVCVCVRERDSTSHTALSSGSQQSRPAGRAELWVPAQGPGPHPLRVWGRSGYDASLPEQWFPAPSRLCPLELGMEGSITASDKLH